MVRPRRPFSGQEVIVERPAEWYEDQNWVGAPGSRATVRLKSQRNECYRVANGILDPLTYYLVVDALLRIDHQIELRPSVLAEWMAVKYPQMSFDSKTLGRVLFDLWECLVDARNYFINEGRDWKGRFYLLSPEENYVKGMWKLRDDLWKLAEAAIAASDAGNRVPTFATPLAECPSLRGEFVELA